MDISAACKKEADSLFAQIDEVSHSISIFLFFRSHFKYIHSFVNPLTLLMS